MLNFAYTSIFSAKKDNQKGTEDSFVLAELFSSVEDFCPNEVLSAFKLPDLRQLRIHSEVSLEKTIRLKDTTFDKHSRSRSYADV